MIMKNKPQFFLQLHVVIKHVVIASGISELIQGFILHEESLPQSSISAPAAASCMRDVSTFLPWALWLILRDMFVGSDRHRESMGRAFTSTNCTGAGIPRHSLFAWRGVGLKVDA